MLRDEVLKLQFGLSIWPKSVDFRLDDLPTDYPPGNRSFRWEGRPFLMDRSVQSRPVPWPVLVRVHPLEALGEVADELVPVFQTFRIVETVEPVSHHDTLLPELEECETCAPEGKNLVLVDGQIRVEQGVRERFEDIEKLFVSVRERDLSKKLSFNNPALFCGRKDLDEISFLLAHLTDINSVRSSVSWVLHEVLDAIVILFRIKGPPRINVGSRRKPVPNTVLPPPR